MILVKKNDTYELFLKKPTGRGGILNFIFL